jgi:hypothetical protein
MSYSTDVTFTSGSSSMIIFCGTSGADAETPPVGVQEVYINGSKRTASSWFTVTSIEPYGSDIRGTLTCLRPADKFAELCAQNQSGHVLINAAQSFTINVFFSP